MRLGLKSYFTKYAYKNTEYQDFIDEMAIAAETLNISKELVHWSDTWLKTDGINIIDYSFKED